jgi:CDP-glucose 4,6-dehydratase
VLVTGHTGFKGAWLSLWLQRLGAQVSGYALAPPTTPSLFAQARVGDGMPSSIIADVRDLPRLSEAVRAAQPEVVFHLAAQSIVRIGYDDPVGTYATNVMGTVHVLEAARATARAIVVVTSDKCYEPEPRPRSEHHRLGGRDPYASSKACAELVTAAYRASFAGAAGGGAAGAGAASGGAAIASARAGNVIGGGDWAAHRIVPDAMRAFLAGTPLVLRHPDSTRPWQHVLDPLAGYLRLAERLLSDGAPYAEAWNFGPAGELAVPVREIATRLAFAWGGGASWQRSPAATGPHEAEQLELDSTKARDRLAWRPRLSLDDALLWTVEWHRAVARGDDARDITTAQLDRYSQLLG